MFDRRLSYPNAQPVQPRRMGESTRSAAAPHVGGLARAWAWTIALAALVILVLAFGYAEAAPTAPADVTQVQAHQALSVLAAVHHVLHLPDPTSPEIGTEIDWFDVMSVESAPELTLLESDMKSRSVVHAWPPAARNTLRTHLLYAIESREARMIPLGGLQL
jgi:hypothetical protein